MAFLDRIRECNTHDLSRHHPLVASGRRVGYLRMDRVELLLGCAASFAPHGTGVELRGGDFASRTSALAAAMAALASAGVVSEPRGEVYPVAVPVRGEPVCAVDRAYVAWLGVSAAGVHVNGIVRSPAGLRMWIAHRSRDKATHPGMLDNIVAGGQPHGIGLFDNVVKECGEEAGIPTALARTARPVGAVSYVFEDSTGLKPDTMFCFDLELLETFEPVPVDGEVERFECLPISEVAELVRDTRRFKFNCNLVVIDFLVRHGLIAADEPEYRAIVDGLRQPLLR